MTRLTPVHGDITAEAVDVVVLATGRRGWAGGGDLPARWVIHTTTPDHAAGQRDPRLLEECYRGALAVADELGARTVAFPLLGAGAHRWPRAEAIAAALEAIATSSTRVAEVRLVARDRAVFEDLHATMAQWTPFRLLEGVRVLHERGYHRVRVHPSVSPSGMYWRLVVAVDGGRGEPLRYTTGNLTQVADATVTRLSSPAEVADLLLAHLAPLVPAADDPAYARWFAGLMDLVERGHALPIAGADYFDDTLGWEVGWGSGVRYPNPPAAV